MRIVLSGPPKIGRSTLLNKITTMLDALNPIGCIVDEIKEKNLRIGFMIKYFPEKKRNTISKRNNKIVRFLCSQIFCWYQQYQQRADFFYAEYSS